MKLPKAFIPEDLKGINIKISKKHRNQRGNINSLEYIIPKEILGFKKREEHKPIFVGDVVLKGGVDTKSLKKTAVVWYNMERMVLLQYKTETHLLNNLKNIFENGLVLYSGNKIKFTKRFLFKDDISVYLDGGEKFVKELIPYYRKLGFKQLGYELKET